MLKHARKKSADDIQKYFSYFFQQIGFDISRKLSSKHDLNENAYFLGKIIQIF